MSAGDIEPQKLQCGVWPVSAKLKPIRSSRVVRRTNRTVSRRLLYSLFPVHLNIIPKRTHLHSTQSFNCILLVQDRRQNSLAQRLNYAKANANRKQAEVGVHNGRYSNKTAGVKVDAGGKMKKGSKLDDYAPAFSRRTKCKRSDSTEITYARY